jgi:5-hydroxyisourate hydrolase-like protein (transthyretin family)
MVLITIRILSITYLAIDKMATQKLDTELDVCRKCLHFSQRDLYRARFKPNDYYNKVYFETADDLFFEVVVIRLLDKVKYWRIRYNAACAVEQTREDERYFNWIED